MEIKTINDKINHDILLSQRKAKREMTKKGFVNVDGNIMQYNPNTARFTDTTNNEIISFFNWIVGTSWHTLTDPQIIEYLKTELPNLTERSVNNFNSYIQQSQITIDNERISNLFKEAIEDNNTFKNPKVNFKGKLNIQSELTVLRNNDIFSDGNFKLYKLKDNEFEMFDTTAVLGLFRSTIGTANPKLVKQYIKNNWRIYISNLTDIKELLHLIKVKTRKENTMIEAEKGFNEVMEVIKGYGGK